MANVQRLQDEFLIADEKYRRALIDGAEWGKVQEFKHKRDSSLNRLLSVCTGDDTQPVTPIVEDQMDTGSGS